MNESKNLHAIRIYLLINVATALSALIDLLKIPTDPKNAWLLGYSQTRLFGAAALFLVAGGFVILAIRVFFSELQAMHSVKSFKNHLGTRWLYDIYLTFSTIVFIFSAIFGARFRDYPVQEANSYMIIRAYPFLIWMTAFALTTVLLLIILRRNRNSGYSRAIAWLNEHLAQKNFESAVLVVLVLIFVMVGRNHLSDAKVVSDNLEAARAAFFLRTSGSIAKGLDENGIPILTARREPLPAFVGAVNMIINPSFWRDFTLSDVNTGDLIVPFKSVNLFWSSLFLVSAYFLAKKMFYYPLPAFIVSSSLTYFVVIRSRYYDGGFHEVASVALLVLTSLLVFRLMEKLGRKNGILFGISLSLLALTKAAFFYVGAAYFLYILVTWLLEKKMTKETFVVLLVAFMSFALPTLGWMARNKYHLNSFVLTARGGDVLYHRVLNTAHPMWGSVYAFSPPVFRDIISGFTDYTSEDVSEGGRLGDLITGNPSYVQYHRKEIYNQMLLDARAAGESINGPLEGDQFLLREAIKEIRNDPQAYLRGTPGLAWRGIWELKPDQYGFNSDFGAGVILPLINLSVFASLILFIPFALLNKNFRLATLFVLPFGLYLFHTLFSHNQSRFNYPIQPYLWLSTLYFIRDGLAIAFGRKSNISKHVI